MFYIVEENLKSNTVSNRVFSFIEMEDLCERMAAKPGEMWIVTNRTIVTAAMEKHGLCQCPQLGD